MLHTGRAQTQEEADAEVAADELHEETLAIQADEEGINEEDEEPPYREEAPYDQPDFDWYTYK